MDFQKYQKAVKDTAIYPPECGLAYTALGLAGEAGEVANKVKKVYRDSKGLICFDDIGKIADELGDVLWYVAAVANEIGHSLDGIASRNIEKLLSRKERGTLSGSGDNR